MPYTEGAAALSADGSVLALGGSKDDRKKDAPVTALVWDVEKNEKRAEVAVVQNQYANVALSPDAKLLATWGTHFDPNPPKDGTDPATDPNRIVQFWDAATGKELGKFRSDGYGSASVVFAPSGQTVAVSPGGGSIRASRSEDRGGEAAAVRPRRPGCPGRVFSGRQNGGVRRVGRDGPTVGHGRRDGRGGRVPGRATVGRCAGAAVHRAGPGGGVGEYRIGGGGVGAAEREVAVPARGPRQAVQALAFAADGKEVGPAGWTAACCGGRRRAGRNSAR